LATVLPDAYPKVKVRVHHHPHPIGP
jgi:hypothetical protein